MRVPPETAGAVAGVLDRCGFARSAPDFWRRTGRAGSRAPRPRRDGAPARPGAHRRPARAGRCGQVHAACRPRRGLPGSGPADLHGDVAGGRPARLHAPARRRRDPAAPVPRVATRHAGRPHAARGRVVVFDRYTYDALLPITGSWRLLKRPYFWVLAHLAPRPDLVLVLDLPGEVAFAARAGARPRDWRPSGRASWRWSRAWTPRSSTQPPRRSRSRRRRRPDVAAPPRPPAQPATTGSVERSPVSSSTRAAGDPAVTRRVSDVPGRGPAPTAPPATPRPHCSRSPRRAGRRPAGRARARPAARRGPPRRRRGRDHRAPAAPAAPRGHGGDRRRAGRPGPRCGAERTRSGRRRHGHPERHGRPAVAGVDADVVPTACSTCTPRPR